MADDKTGGNGANDMTKQLSGIRRGMALLTGLVVADTAMLIVLLILQM